MLSVLLLASLAAIGIAFDLTFEDETENDTEDTLDLDPIDTSVNGVQLTEGDDTYIGQSSDVEGELLYAGSGSEIIANDFDPINGRGGNDTLIAGAGLAEVLGGAGDDHIDVSRTETYLVFGGEGDDFIVGSEVSTSLWHTQIDAGAGNDSIAGGASSEIAFGNSGNDFISGSDGDDWISGGLGADILSGGDGNDILDHNGREAYFSQWNNHASPTFTGALDGTPDTLEGGDGNDTLRFEAGDIATGGDGSDYFEIFASDASLEPAIVTDFESGDHVEIILPPASVAINELTVNYDSDHDITALSTNQGIVAVLHGNHTELTIGYSNLPSNDNATGGNYITQDGTTLEYDPRIGNIDIRIISFADEIKLS